MSVSSKQDFLNVNVFLQNNDLVVEMQDKLNKMQFLVDEYKKEVSKLRTKLCDEQYVNIELIDMVKALGGRFRPGLDIRNW